MVSGMTQIDIDELGRKADELARIAEETDSEEANAAADAAIDAFLAAKNSGHIYSEAQATDEAILRLVRRLRRDHENVYIELMNRLPEGARDALDAADLRADRLRARDAGNGIKRNYLTTYPR
jgi:hypothetical protein